MATAEFSTLAGILSAALSQHHRSGFELAQLVFHYLHYFVRSDAFQGPLDFTFQDVWLWISDHIIMIQPFNKGSLWGLVLGPQLCLQFMILIKVGLRDFPGGYSG